MERSLDVPLRNVAIIVTVSLVDKLKSIVKLNGIDIVGKILLEYVFFLFPFFVFIFLIEFTYVILFHCTFLIISLKIKI